jgi:hypothetical protein
MYWIVGIGTVLYVGYKVLSMRRNLIRSAIDDLENKIRHNRERARGGDRAALLKLRSLDALVKQLEVEATSSSSAQQVLSTLVLDGLYPPSAI